MSKQKKESKGKPVNFILSDENQELIGKYKLTLPAGSTIRPSEFFNLAVKEFIEKRLEH